MTRELSGISEIAWMDVRGEEKTIQETEVVYNNDRRSARIIKVTFTSRENL